MLFGLFQRKSIMAAGRYAGPAFYAFFLIYNYKIFTPKGFYWAGIHAAFAFCAA